MNVNWSFNAQQHEPNQGLSGHPPANKIPFTITNTAIVETKDKTGGMLVVDLTSPLGTMVQRYNINNASPKAVEIAYGQLSALCRAVNIYQIDGQNECAVLRGGKGLMDVGYQKGEEPDPAFPDRKGYTELKRVYDVVGNDPSKPSAGQAPQQAQSNPAANGPTPQTQQPNGSWGSGAAQPQQTAQQPANQAGGAWQPGGNTSGPAASPPWGQR